jgi:hypothetical protein
MGVAAVAAGAIGLLVLWVAMPPARAQLPISTTTTTKPATTTTRPVTSTSAASTTTTAKPRPTTTRPKSTTTGRPTTTIPTPPPAAPTTTTTVVPRSKNSGKFSPVFTVLAFFGFLAAIGLLVLQWFLTKPGRHGWTL